MASDRIFPKVGSKPANRTRQLVSRTFDLGSRRSERDVEYLLGGDIEPVILKGATVVQRVCLLLLSLSALLLAGCSSPSTKSNSHPHLLQVEIGDSDFRGGDSLQITEVRGTHPTYVPGGEYVVSGTYVLNSTQEARLLLATTTSNTRNSGPIDPNQRLQLKAGTGSFKLTHKMPAAGYPHLTFYGSSGSGVGGVYFGTGSTVLRDKGYRYSGE